MDTNVPDYEDAVRTAVEKLASLHGLNPEKLIQAAIATKDDVLRCSITESRLAENSLPLDFAANLVFGFRHMLMSAATTVLNPRIHHPRLGMMQPQQLIDAARFGHTEPGSFVVKVSCPVNAVEGTPLPLDGSEEPFVRQTTLAIYDSLQTLLNAVEGNTLTTLVDGLKSSQTPSISSNFCEALTYFYDQRLENAAEVSFDWSVRAGAPRGINTRRRFRLQRDYFGRIEEVRQELRSAILPVRDSFIGTVERLCGEIGADGRRAGEVILGLLLRDGQTTQARLILNADQYVIADEAHMAGASRSYVQVTGVLSPGRQPCWLTDVTQFELVNSHAIEQAQVLVR